MVNLIGYVGGFAAFLMLAIGWIILVEAIRFLAGWKVDAEVARLRARLADVEALRRRDQFHIVPPVPGQEVPPMIREHLGDRPICDETEGDCA